MRWRQEGRTDQGLYIIALSTARRYSAGMNSNDLSKQQVEQLLSKMWPMLRYLKRLKDRMERRSFPKEDELYRLVARIHDDMHHLSVTLHYMTCNGVGRPSRRSKGPSGEAGVEGR